MTFQEPGLLERLTRHCALATRDPLPGYRGPGLGQDGAARLDRLAAALEPGDAASNVAVLLSLPDGRLLHVVPGFSPPERLARALDLALALRQAIRGRSRAEAEQVAARTHAAHARARPDLRRAHELLVRRPLVDASLIGPADYADPAADGGPGPGKAVLSFGE